MTETALLDRIQADMKAALKGGDKQRLSTLRLAIAAIKQVQIDQKTTLDAQQTLAILDRMVKQRRESISQFEAAGRTDLADKEIAEIAILKDYLPEPLSESEIQSMIEQAIADSGAASVRDMGKVMGLLKPAMQGRADLSRVSATVKTRLTTG